MAGRTARIYGMVAAVLGAAALGAAPASAQTDWSLGTSSTGSGPYVNGVVIANHVNAAQRVVAVSPQTTGGYNENLALVAAKRIDVGMTNLLDLDAAYEGTDKFENVAGKEVFENLRALFIHAGSVVHFLTRADSGIRKFEDIRGRKINLNTPSTFTRGFNESILKAAGIGLDEIEVFSISTGKHFDALRDRVIDAGFHGYALNLASLQELNATTPVFLLSLPDPAFDRLNDMYGGRLTRFTVPANTYDGQTEPSKTILSTNVLFVHADADEEEVYAFTKAFWESIDEMAKENGSFKGITREIGKYSGTTPVHPGAARYFEETGK